MAAFDEKFGHIVVRVVYDGPASSGKTENLKQLVKTFTSQRRGELSSPRQRDGSTPYFDWLYLNGGVVSGHGLRAQLVTVPGRSVLTRRRWQLVKTADVIVFVCESTARGVKEGKRWLELLRARLASTAAAPPLVVQANKQDLPDALPPGEVARALGLASDAELVAATATSGSGVRETVVRAIRAAASLAERDIIARGIEGLRSAEDESELLAQLDGSAQMRRALAGDDVPPFPDEDVASDCVWPATSGRTVLRSLARALASEGVEHMPSDDGAIVVRAGAFFLRTSRAGRFDDAEAARAALVARARAQVRLDEELAAQTTLVLALGADGSSWLWAIAPWAETPQKSSRA
jgi:signal recognition particle receptor subunit beta